MCCLCALSVDSFVIRCEIYEAAALIIRPYWELVEEFHDYRTLYRFAPAERLVAASGACLVPGDALDWE
jgi:hypothetical protein